MSGKTVLLFNPWIYDFAAYDLWTKPIGLLYVGAVLRQIGYDIHLIDCLDRHHPSVAQVSGTDRRDASGKFIRSEIEKPSVLSHVPRKYCRYGMPPEIVLALLQDAPPPDAILVTSTMTYWYPAVRDAVAILRRCYPRTPILLGGVYATLCADHAFAVVRPDELIAGEAEVAAARRLADLFGETIFEYDHLDELPFPAYDLYPKLTSVPLLTSRGCPNSCSFCASKSLTPNYRRRSSANVLAEIDHWHNRFGVHHFAFFDDALLHRADLYVKPILRGIIERRWGLHFHTPNGLTPRYIDAELAQLFFDAGVQTVRLSFETANPDRQRSMSAKVTNDELKRALDHLEQAGYRRSDIGVYVLMGLPDQPPEEFRRSALMVHDLGARAYAASFSPIPHTREWQKATASNLWDENDDLLLTNTTLFPIWSKIYGYAFCAELLQWAKELNRSIDGCERESMGQAQFNLCDIQESFIS